MGREGNSRSGGERLFLYGTLRDPARLAAVLGGRVWRELGDATLRGALYDVGEYPGLLLGGDDFTSVPGRLVEVGSASALAVLDQYEEVAAGLYGRCRCTVTTADGGRDDAWVYVYRRSVAGLVRIVAWPPLPSNPRA